MRFKIDKWIKGYKYRFYVKILFGSTDAEVRYFTDDIPIIGKISEDFKYITLPDDYAPFYITDYGYVKIGKLKLKREYSIATREYVNYLI